MILPWSLLPFLDSLQNWSTDTNFSLQSQMFQYSDLWIEKSWISKVSNSWTRDHWADELLGWSWTSHRSHLGFSNLIDRNQKITINWNLGNVVYRIHIWCLSITDTVITAWQVISGCNSIRVRWLQTPATFHPPSTYSWQTLKCHERHYSVKGWGWHPLSFS